MADITTCEGKDCPLKEKCYRYTAEPCKYRQSYFLEPPYKEDGHCDYAWPNYEKRKPNQCGKEL